MTNGEKFKEVFGFGADGSRVIAVNSTWWDCEFQNRKPITNADHVRSMTDEELAKWLSCPGRKEDMFPNLEIYIAPNTDEWLEWLRQEVKE